ncbi:hypothetical protein KC19_5G197700 [Ceratodon purpureus]|uniref:Uncharacterized protein n=1 Tax=Ceratodon purpureus TaxID=3225 RepID=A0A8T0I4G6_CERPU|nr:hypothetical protein KC19_5G197700 [Ceratodon purpureus]
MFCCWSKAAVDVIDHETGTESQTIIDLGPGRSLHPLLEPVVNQGFKRSSSIKSVSDGDGGGGGVAAAAQIDFPDGQLSQRVRKLFSAKSQVSTTAELIWKPQDSSGTDTDVILITADASGDQVHDELNKDLPEYETFSYPKDAVNVMRWDARFLSNDVATHEFSSYFPVVVNLENGELFAFNNHQVSRQNDESFVKYSEWLAMPGIGFLPNDVMDIIAGGGGLLCVNGGIQPRKKNLHTPPIPHAEDYNHRLYPQQSILVVCNPLTEEIKFLPRHTNKKLDDKIACLQVLKNNGPGNHGENRSSKSRLRYRVHVVGGHHERPSLRGPASDELVFMTYDSRSDTWISGMAVGRARIPALAKTGIACQEEGFYLGGQEESDEVTMVVKGDTGRIPLQGRSKRVNSRVQHHAAGTGGGGRFRNRRVWINKIFFIQASTLKWHSVDFDILGEDGLPHPAPLQAPRVVQCRPGGPVYAVTRAKEAATTIEIYEVAIVKGFPSGEFIPVTKMPDDIFMNLFESETSMREYDCAAGIDYICFLVGPPNQSTIGVCDLRRQKWFMSIFPADPSGTGHYALAKTQWSPSSTVQA